VDLESLSALPEAVADGSDAVVGGKLLQTMGRWQEVEQHEALCESWGKMQQLEAAPFVPQLRLLCDTLLEAPWRNLPKFLVKLKGLEDPSIHLPNLCETQRHGALLGQAAAAAAGGGVDEALLLEWELSCIQMDMLALEECATVLPGLHVCWLPVDPPFFHCWSGPRPLCLSRWDRCSSCVANLCFNA
jgi:hypothetical protein